MFIAIITPLAVVIALIAGVLAAARWEHRYHDDPEPDCDYCIDQRHGSPDQRAAR